MVADRLAMLVVTLLSLGVGTGCAGARTSVVADGSSYPISLSRAVRDEDGAIVASSRTEKVGTLRKDVVAWGTLYSAVKLTPRTDISQAVNEQVAKAGGEAVVNLQIRSTYCASDFFVVLTAIPFWPGCVNIQIEGDIVKVTRSEKRTDSGSSNGVAVAR